MVHDIKGIAFEGGGVLGIAHVGAIQKLNELKKYDKITHFAGSSVGSLVASLCACRASVAYMKKAIDIDFNSLLDDSYGITTDINRLITKFGYYKGDALENLFSSYLKELTGNSDITFGDVYKKYGTTLIITVTDVYKKSCKTIFYNKDTYPDMPIKKAARMSSSYPFIFASKEYTTDGGLLDNYPIKSLYTYLQPSEVIGLKFAGERVTDCTERPSNIVEFTKSILAAIQEQAQQLQLEQTEWERTILIDNASITSMDFSITAKEKESLFNNGYSAVGKFYNIA